MRTIKSPSLLWTVIRYLLGIRQRTLPSSKAPASVVGLTTILNHSMQSPQRQQENKSTDVNLSRQQSVTLLFTYLHAHMCPCRHLNDNNGHLEVCCFISKTHITIQLINRFIDRFSYCNYQQLQSGVHILLLFNNCYNKDYILTSSSSLGFLYRL